MLLPPPPAEVRPALPGWWTRFLAAASLESDFLQTSESAVFGSLQKKGRVLVARGGRLRVTYEPGLLLISNGERLIQYDPQTRTAQSLDLAKAMGEFPLLNLLVNPRQLEQSYRVESLGSRIRLRPRQAGLPEVEVEGRESYPSRISWKDGTGAQQRLDLGNPRPAKVLNASSFRFEAPKGTRWLGLHP